MAYSLNNNHLLKTLWLFNSHPNTKNNMKTFLIFVSILVYTSANAQIKIGNNPNTIDPSSIVEMEDTTKGLLIPRMTTAQRDLISAPPDGLKIYNTETSTMDVYRFDQWESTVYKHPNSKEIYVYSLEDLPSPSGSVITLDASMVYVFNDIVNISPYYIDLNGASLRGLEPARDGVASNVNGAILRSTDETVFLQDFAVFPLSVSTKAYDFSDATGTKFCNLFSGNSVIDNGVASLGVGKISGFKSASIFQNYWSCKDGIKIDGNIGKLTCAFCFITNITAGSGVEFLGTMVADDIDLSNNYFVYPGQTGVKFNVGASVDRGRMTTNIFRDVTLPLDGFDSYSLGWSMKQNTDVPDSRAYSFIYFNSNSTATPLPSSYPNFYKIEGTTISIDQKRFTTSNNRITYVGVTPISAKVSVVISAKAPANNSDFSVGLGKNGVALVTPISSMAPSTSNQSFQIILNTEVTLTTGDYLEVYISRNNTNTSSLTVNEMQFRVTD